MKNFFLKDLQGDLYFGKGAGKDIFKNLQNLKSGDEVTIISPYFGLIYTSTFWHDEHKNVNWDFRKDIILNLLKNNITVNFITSKSSGRRNFLDKVTEKNEIIKVKRKKDYNLYLENSKKFKNYEFYIWLTILGLFFLPFFSFIFKIILVVIMFLIRSLKLNKIPEKDIEIKEEENLTFYKLKDLYKEYIEFENDNFNLFVSDEFIHSKIFVLNDTVAYIGTINFTFTGFKENYETRITITDKEKINELLNKINFLKSELEEVKFSDEILLDEFISKASINNEI